MRVTRVPAVRGRHLDWLSSHLGGVEVSFRPGAMVWQLEHRGRVLTFLSRDQMRTARDWFAAKTHPSTRRPPPPGEHHWQPWHCRLPRAFLRGPVRAKVVRALDAALACEP